MVDFKKRIPLEYQKQLLSDIIGFLNHDIIIPE